MSRNEQFATAVRLFNDREFFACHDVLEELWSDAVEPERTYLQGLIHAAVALFHFTEGNLTGARKMHDSALRYLADSQDVAGGLQLDRFRREFSLCFAPLLGARTEYPQDVVVDSGTIPQWHWHEAES